MLTCVDPGSSMKALSIHLCALLLMAAFSGAVFAQKTNDSTGYHPFLSDKFHLGLGGFWPEKSFKIRVDGSDPTEEIDFEEDLAYDESESTTSLNFRWRYSKNWSLWGQYWVVDSEESAILTEDIEWKDVIYKEGTFASSGVDVSITRIFLGRSFWKKPGQIILRPRLH